MNRCRLCQTATMAVHGVTGRGLPQHDPASHSVEQFCFLCSRLPQAIHISDRCSRPASLIVESGQVHPFVHPVPNTILPAGHFLSAASALLAACQQPLPGLQLTLPVISEPAPARCCCKWWGPSRDSAKLWYSSSQLAAQQSAEHLGTLSKSF